MAQTQDRSLIKTPPLFGSGGKLNVGLLLSEANGEIHLENRAAIRAGGRRRCTAYLNRIVAVAFRTLASAHFQGGRVASYVAKLEII